MSGNSPHRATRRVLPVVMAVVLITSVFAGGVLAAESPSESEIADEAYVTSEGDAVLVYEEDVSESGTGEFGVDVSEGVVYALLTDDLEEDVSAAFDLWADPGSVNSSTAITADRPEEIDDFSMNVSGAYTDEEASFDADTQLAINASEEPSTMYLNEATTEGSIESSADHVATSGEYVFDMNMPQTVPTETVDVAVSGTEGNYSLDVHQKRALSSAEVDRWENEKAAQKTLEQQFGVVAADLGGEATVTIDDYTLEEEYGEQVLDIEYSVEYENLDAFAPVVAANIADDPRVDLTEDEAEAFLDAAFGVEMKTVEVSHSQHNAAIEGEWNADVRNLTPLAESAIDLFEGVDNEKLEELGVTGDLRAQLEAQTASELVQTTEWNAELAGDDETLTLTASMSGESENWETYVDELEERGVERNVNLTFEGHGATVDDELEFELAVEVDQDELFDTGLAALTQQLENDSSVSDEDLEVWQTLEDAGFQVAGLDLDASDGTTTVTAGAKFDNFTAFQEIIEDEFHGVSVSHVYGEMSDETETRYLYADGMVDADPTEDDVRETALVDSETEIHLDASLEDHPRLDVAAVNEFLGVESETGNENETDAGNETDGGNETDSDDGDADGDGMPGFGVTAAITVLLSIALLRSRN